MKKIFLFLVAATLMLGACMKKDPCPPCPEAPEPPEPPYVPTVYVSGYANSNDPEHEGHSLPVLWVDGELQYLNGSSENPYGLGSNVFDVFVTEEGDVYATGASPEVRGEPHNAVVWKNGEIVDRFGGDYAIGHHIVIVGDDVYVAGVEQGTNWEHVTLWKNGVKQTLAEDLTENSSVTSLFVYEGDTYVTGYLYNRNTYRNVAKLWVNGQEETLSDGTEDVEAHSVFVYEGDLYVGLINRNTATFSLLKNGTEEFTYSLAVGPAWCVYVEDGDVYVGGATIRNGEPTAIWMKNGVAQYQSYDYTLVRALQVFDGVPYMLGFGAYDSVALVWKYNIMQTLTFGPTGSGHAFGLFVK